MALSPRWPSVAGAAPADCSGPRELSLAGLQAGLSLGAGRCARNLGRVVLGADSVMFRDIFAPGTVVRRYRLYAPEFRKRVLPSFALRPPPAPGRKDTRPDESPRSRVERVVWGWGDGHPLSLIHI